jgi:hypothetical protein
LGSTMFIASNPGYGIDAINKKQYAKETAALPV